MFYLHRRAYVNTTGYGLDGRGSIPDKGKIFSLPQCPARLWSLPSLLYIGYQGLFLRDKAART
jgi:hypothetical protein